MKNKVINVAASDLNAATVTPFICDAMFTIKNLLYTTRQIRIENNSGVDILYNIMKTQQEYNDYLSDPSAIWWTFLPLPNARVVIDPSAGSIFNVLLLNQSGQSASSTVNIYLMNYFVLNP